MEVALAELAAADVQLGQLLDVDVDEAEVVVAELALALLRPLVGAGGRPVGQAVQALGPEDVPDAVPVQLRQEVPQREGQAVEGEAGAAPDRADDGPVRGSAPYAPTLGAAMASRLVELARSVSAWSLPDAAVEDGGCGKQRCDAQHATHGGEERVTQHLRGAPE